MVKCYEKATSVFWRKIEDQVLLIFNDRIYNLKNESAVRIWELIDGKNSLAQIKEKMMDEFEIDSLQAENDFSGFLKQLKDTGLIKQVG